MKQRARFAGAPGDALAELRLRRLCVGAAGMVASLVVGPRAPTLLLGILLAAAAERRS